MADRNLTDADVAEIVDRLKEGIVRDLYTEAGKGLWGYLRKIAGWVVLALAVYSISGGRSLSDILATVK